MHLSLCVYIYTHTQRQQVNLIILKFRCLKAKAYSFTIMGIFYTEYSS